MGYNEYLVEYQRRESEKILTNFSFIEAKSPKDAEEKMLHLLDEDWVKIVDVKLCDEKYWSLG